MAAHAVKVHRSRLPQDVATLLGPRAAAAAARGTQEQHPRDTLLHAVRELVLKSFLHFSDEHAGTESAGESTAEAQG